MVKKNKSNPAKHSRNSFYDQRAASLVSAWLAESHRAMPDIKANDRWPNIDGYVELVDLKGFPLGKVEVQIKKLSSKNAPKLKHSFKDDKFLIYCKSSLNWIPKIFIGVDINTSQKYKAYWEHIDGNYVNNLNGSKTIAFQKNKILKSGDDSFVNEWLKLVDQYKYRAEEFEKYKNAYALISNTVTPVLGIVDQRFEVIHLFLDSLNDLLDNEFEIVKKIYYPDTWKVGFAYYKFTESEVSYVLYPIPYTKNDIQIKQITGPLQEQLQKEGLGFSGFFRNNPIADSPQTYPFDVIQHKINRILDNKLLDHTGNIFLAKEFIFAFVSQFHIQMGLSEKNSYTISEISHGFHWYLPLWLTEAYRILHKKMDYPKKNYLDPSVISFLRLEERKVIAKRVDELLTTETSLPGVQMGSDELPFGIFLEYLNFLKKEVDVVKSPYLPRDYSRLSDHYSVWSVHSKKDFDSNISTFFEHLSTCYRKIVETNFPLLDEELDLFDTNQTIAVHWRISENYRSRKDEPTFSMFYLLPVQVNDSVSKIILLSDSDIEKLSGLDKLNKEITLRGNKFRIISHFLGQPDFILEKTPMLNFIYKVLEDKLNKYFKEEKDDGI